jgi:sec-independent protein translocase protein TatA
MNFFGIGGPELIIIAVAALIIFGPGKLPEVAGQAGRAVRDFRRMTTDLSGEFEKTLNESGAGELRDTVNKELRGMRSQVESVGKSVERDLNKGSKSVSSGVKSANKGTGTGSRAGSNVKKAPGKTGTSGSSSTRAAASGGSTAAKTKAVTPKPATPVELKATKANPLADVSFMDLDQETEASPAPREAVLATSGSKRDASSNTSAPSSAITRARERRIAAGYSRARL